MTNGRPSFTVQEAMDALGVSDKTIRRLLKRGDLEQEGTIHGRILISAESVERVAKNTPRHDEPDEPTQPRQSDYSMVPVSHYEALQRTNQTLAEAVHDQAAYIRQLQERLAELEARERYSPQVDTMRQEMEALRAEIRAMASPGTSPGASLSDQTPKKRSVMQRIKDRFGM